jgi:hypothetical protein
MKTIGAVIRKDQIIENGKVRFPSKKNFKKQILTFHRRTKKKDDIKTQYTFEKDDHRFIKYHAHLVIHYNDEKNLYNQLNRFIGGNDWIIVKDGLHDIKINKGRWGEIRLHDLYDVEGFEKGYMSKFNPSETFY